MTSRKNSLFVILLFAFIVFPYSLWAERPEPVLLNRHWTFNYLPSGQVDEAILARDFDDSAWPAIAIPHTWQTYETTGEMHPFMRNPSERDDPYWWYGLGYYRKRFELDPGLEGKRFFLEFDGVQKHAHVFLNGRKVGEHLGGYNSFSMNVTDFVRFDGANVLVLAVSNRRDDPTRIPPMYAGNFNIYGGIYRDVRLVVTDPLHIPYQGNSDHEGGTFITTPSVHHEEATVRVRTWVKNTFSSPRALRLESVILDPEGRIVTKMNSKQTVRPGEMAEIDQQSEDIEAPHLWSPDSPAVYRVLSKVYDGNRLADTVESSFGFRWYRWDHDTDSLYLNGEPVHIHGTNRHQEYPWLGDAIPKWLHEEEMKDIRVGIGHEFHTRDALPE